ncbi:MAG: hypothetical protein IKT05_07175 [Fibrobacter sp.]|nr:hypothetical protein [Fibrobacter sp.]
MKMKYFAPDTELVEITIEVNFMGTVNGVMNAFGNTSTEDATDYGDGSVIGW